MSGEMVDLERERIVRKRLKETGYTDEIGDCIAYRSAVYEINYGDTAATCTLCGGSPDTHEEDPNEASHPWPGPRLA